MNRIFVSIAGLFLACADVASAGALIQLNGQIFKWGSPISGSGAVITYAVLTRAYIVPSDLKTLSRDNCESMNSFADILTSSAGISQASAQIQLVSALAAWQEVADVTFIEVYDIQRANIIVGATAEPKGKAFANLSYRSGLGRTSPVAKALGQDEIERNEQATTSKGDVVIATIEKAYICLNPRERWKIGFDGNLDTYDLRYVFIHEIGHAIGLDHPSTSGHIMAYRYDERLQNLQPSDIKAVQLLYGPSKTVEQTLYGQD